MAKRRKRRAPGTGYASKATNGTWTAFFPRVQGGQHVRRGFDTRTHAEAWLDSLLTQRNEKVDIASGQLPADVWMDRWKERAAKEREWKAKMIADVEFKLGYAKPYLEGRALADVLPDHIDAMLDELARNLAENTIRQIRNYIYQVFESAVKRRYIMFNPVIKPERRKKPRQKEPQRLSMGASAILLHAADETFYGLAWWLILCCGLRAGEAGGLRQGDVDLDRCTLFVAQEYTDLQGHAHQDLPKNDKQRLVPFPRGLVPRFEAHLVRLTRRAAQGVQKGYWQEHTLLFPGRGGRPMNTTSLWHMLQRLLVQAQLAPISTHNLRHTCGGLLHSLGAPQDIIGGILGHGPQTITGHYAPPDIETMRPWIDRLYVQLSGEVEQVRGRREA